MMYGSSYERERVYSRSREREREQRRFGTRSPSEDEHRFKAQKGRRRGRY